MPYAKRARKSAQETARLRPCGRRWASCRPRHWTSLRSRSSWQRGRQSWVRQGKRRRGCKGCCWSCRCRAVRERIGVLRRPLLRRLRQLLLQLLLHQARARWSRLLPLRHHRHHQAHPSQRALVLHRPLHRPLQHRQLHTRRPRLPLHQPSVLRHHLLHHPEPLALEHHHHLLLRQARPAHRHRLRFVPLCRRYHNVNASRSSGTRSARKARPSGLSCPPQKKLPCRWRTSMSSLPSQQTSPTAQLARRPPQPQPQQ